MAWDELPIEGWGGRGIGVSPRAGPEVLSHSPMAVPGQQGRLALGWGREQGTATPSADLASVVVWGLVTVPGLRAVGAVNQESLARVGR